MWTGYYSSKSHFVPYMQLLYVTKSLSYSVQKFSFVAEFFVSLTSLITNQLDALISQIYFGRTLYMFRTVPLPIIRSISLYTQQWYVSYMFSDCLQAGSGWNILIRLQAVSKHVWHIPLLCVQWNTPDDGQRNCPKHVECPSKINLRN
jgi:hypothetical protein